MSTVHAPTGAALRSAEPPWRFAWLHAAPHRLAFAAGTLTLAGGALWWLLVLLASWRGSPLPVALPPTRVHALLMGFGAIPMFFAGFLFTAGPRWLGLPPVPARRLLAPLLPQLAGWPLLVLATHGPDPDFGRSLGAIGLAAVAFGWTVTLSRFVALLGRSRTTDRLHARVIAAAGALGAALLWAAVLALATGHFAAMQAATQAGLWGFVAIVFVATLHRMIPFFSAADWPWLDERHPHWLLGLMVAALLLEGTAAAAAALHAALPVGAQAGRALLESLAGAGLLALALRWSLRHKPATRLPAMLHLGLVWLALALLLAGLSQALEAMTGGARSLGSAPLHALTMGFIGSALLSMVTRVSCGQGGRVTVADDFIWRLFWLMQLAAMARVAAALLAPLDTELSAALLIGALLAWTGICLAWATRLIRWYGRPRPDGRPG